MSTETDTLIPNDTPVIQAESAPLRMNIISGTAVIAQVGIWLFLLVVYYFTLSTDIILPSYHPLFNLLATVLSINAILLLQPTHTAAQKQEGTRAHSYLNAVAILSFIAGVTIIWYNKHIHNAPHYTSTHGKLGLITIILLILQVIIGVAQYYTPQLFGSVARAKAVYKYHRISGYAIITLLLINATYGTQTPWFKSKYAGLWLFIFLDVLVLAGLAARIKPSKMKLF